MGGGQGVCAPAAPQRLSLSPHLPSTPPSTPRASCLLTRSSSCSSARSSAVKVSLQNIVPGAGRDAQCGPCSAHQPGSATRRARRTITFSCGGRERRTCAKGGVQQGVSTTWCVPDMRAQGGAWAGEQGACLLSHTHRERERERERAWSLMTTSEGGPAQSKEHAPPVSLPSISFSSSPASCTRPSPWARSGRTAAPPAARPRRRGWPPSCHAAPLARGWGRPSRTRCRPTPAPRR